MKVLKSISPYVYPDQLNFKNRADEAWKAIGGESAIGVYPRALHRLMFNYDPYLWSKCFKCTNEARLCFVQPVSLYFDTFFAGIKHELIPFVWDCWPCYFDKMEKWLKKHKVRTAIFTSRQEMDEMKQRFPHINYLWCPEAINTEDYKEGKPLEKRSIDVLEFGRNNEKVLGKEFLPNREIGSSFKHVCTKVGDKSLFSEEQLHDVMEDAKVTICLPRSMTHPEIAGNIETLTQRYWEAMLSRMVIVGHAPQELIDVCGYNPVIELDELPKYGGWSGIISNINEFQRLVDKNRQVALDKGDWKVRMKVVRHWLEIQGYVS